MLTKKTALATILALGATTAAFAYATNPGVQARQEAMQSFGGDLKKLMPMVQGAAPFDAATAQAAFAEMQATAAEVPALFEAHEKDPESKAAESIWDNWDDFVIKAGALETAAAAGAGVDSLDALKTAMGPVNAACKACHMSYKTN